MIIYLRLYKSYMFLKGICSKKKYRKIIIVIGIFSFSNFLAQNEVSHIWDASNASFNLGIVFNFGYQKKPTDTFWESIGPDSNDILELDFGSLNGEVIYAASRNNGVFKTENGGLEWKTVNNGISDNFIRTIASHHQKKNLILAGTFNDGLFLTTNGGENWQHIDAISDTTILDIVFDGDTVYVGTSSEGVYRSFDAGLSWENVTLSKGITKALEVIIDPSFSNRIYCVSNEEASKVNISNDFGETWESFFRNEDILSLSIDPNNSQIIYMGGFGNHVIGDSLYKSINGGQTWETIAVLNSTHLISDILINKVNSNNINIATANNGVLKSDDGGDTWLELNDSLSSPIVTQLQFNPSTTSTLYASTNGNAIFKIEDFQTDLSVNNLTYPLEILLHQNYPNPFNPKTQISYQIPNDGFVSLAVYNSLGEEVGQLVNQYQSKGQYSASFNASKLPSGVYIYKLQSGEFSSTKKMLLTK